MGNENCCSLHRYSRETPKPAPFLSRHGAQIGGIRVFPRVIFTVVRQVRMYCSLTMKINPLKTSHERRRSWTAFRLLCFCMCGRQKPKYPQFEANGWRRHYTRWYTRSGISLVYLWLLTLKYIPWLLPAAPQDTALGHDDHSCHADSLQTAQVSDQTSWQNHLYKINSTVIKDDDQNMITVVAFIYYFHSSDILVITQVICDPPLQNGLYSHHNYFEILFLLGLVILVCLLQSISPTL